MIEWLPQFCKLLLGNKGENTKLGESFHQHPYETDVQPIISVHGQRLHRW